MEWRMCCKLTTMLVVEDFVPWTLKSLPFAKGVTLCDLNIKGFVNWKERKPSQCLTSLLIKLQHKIMQKVKSATLYLIFTTAHANYVDMTHEHPEIVNNRKPMEFQMPCRLMAIRLRNPPQFGLLFCTTLSSMMISLGMELHLHLWCCRS
jgi:hypothetical protein